MKKRIFSGIQPSGNLHIGNYLGAIKNWVKLQDEYDSIFCVVDMHAITVPQDPKELQKKTIEVAKIYLASGIDPKKSSIFIQSHVPAHAELCWILNTLTRNSELTKMTQFKSKSGIQFDFSNLEKELEELQELDVTKIYKNAKLVEGKTILDLINHIKDSTVNPIYKKFKDVLRSFGSVGVGLFDYPVLMAADILLYETEVVPVGEDQVQHVEITRTLGKRFNSKFGETFKLPEAFITKETMRIMGLDDPTKKMSKSATSEYNYIALTDSEESVRKKIKRAVTDSGTEIKYTEDKPALQNLINIYSAFSGKSAKDIEKEYSGKGYADFKADLADVVLSFLKTFQEKYNALTDEEVLKILKEGAEKVRPLAKNKLQEVKEKVGFIL